MTITYRNKFKDLAWFLLHCSLRPRQLILALIAPIGLTIIGMQGIWNEYPAYALAIGFLLMTALWFVVIFALGFGVSLLLMVSRSNRTFLCEHTIAVDEDKLIEETEFNRTEHYWKGIVKVTKTRRYIYLFVGRNMAHLIPVRAFNEPAGADELFGFCKRMKGQKQ